MARQRSPQGLSYSDSEAIREVCSFARRVVPVCRVFGDVEVPGEPIHSKIYGVVPGFQEVNRFHIAQGRFVDDVDVARRARVCVLGDELKQRLFRFADPIGQYVKVADSNFRVIGVMEERRIPSGKAIVSLRDMNQDVYIPITVALEDFQIYSEQAIPINNASVFSLSLIHI